MGLAIGAVTVLLAAQSVKARLLATFRGLEARFLSPEFADAPPGPLSAAALHTLLAVTRALLGVPVRMAHYEDFFRWRAENLRGYKALYEQCATALDRRARRSAGRDFADCSLPMQQQLLAAVPHVRSAAPWWRRVHVAVFAEDWVRFDQYIVQSVLLLFYRTDAWAALGYEAWPGTPRGLERYTLAPSRATEAPTAR